MARIKVELVGAQPPTVTAAEVEAGLPKGDYYLEQTESLLLNTAFTSGGFITSWYRRPFDQVQEFRSARGVAAIWQRSRSSIGWTPWGKIS